MKSLFVFIFFVGFNLNCYSQASVEFGKIALSLVMPDNVENLDQGNISKLETKITQIVTNSGLSSSGWNNNFVIYPKFALYETSVVEGGMESITVVTCDLSLFIKQVENNMLFSSISKTLKGSGKNKALAISNAISKIPIADASFKEFIEVGKQKIVDYYNLRCDDIITEFESLLLKAAYEQALGLLLTVPQEVKCYSIVQEKSIQAYRSFQNQKCNQRIQLAKSKLAANEFAEAIRILGQIDPSTVCFKESNDLLIEASVHFDAQQEKAFEESKRIQEDNLALEKQRVDAIKEIAVEYYRNRPKTIVSYSLLIR